ncbi:MAG: 4-hydroxy-tetrahydrodipicolinate synthase [Christensenellales bacterium]
MIKQVLFRGCATALATPFTADGVDTAALAALTDWQIREGVSALVVCGTTGEPSTMSDSEWALCVETVVGAAGGRVPVIAGTGGNNTAHVLALAKTARSLGAKAQLCVTPYYNKTTQAGLIAHYGAIADAGDLPVILYNVPSRAGLSLSADTLNTLSRHENILALKEAGGDFSGLGDAMLGCGERLSFYSGADEVIVPFMSLGGLGVISVLSNLMPRYVSDLCRAALGGDFQTATRMQLACLPLVHALFSEVSPIPLKRALHLMGKCEDILRLPLVSLSDSGTGRLRQEMLRMGLLT